MKIIKTIEIEIPEEMTNMFGRPIEEGDVDWFVWHKDHLRIKYNCSIKILDK